MIFCGLIWWIQKFIVILHMQTIFAEAPVREEAGGNAPMPCLSIGSDNILKAFIHADS